MAENDARPGFGDERRSQVREATSETVKVVTASGLVFDAEVVDRSMRGMRLQTPQVLPVGGELTVLAPAQGLAHTARVVWRSPPHLGLILLATVDMRKAAAPGDQALRRLWREQLQR